MDKEKEITYLTGIIKDAEKIREWLLEDPEPALKVGDWVITHNGRIAQVCSNDLDNYTSCIEYSDTKNRYHLDTQRLTRTTIQPGDCVRNKENQKLMIVGFVDRVHCYEDEQAYGDGKAWHIENCILIAKGPDGGGE